jgi:hypothetical protein
MKILSKYNDYFKKDVPQTTTKTLIVEEEGDDEENEDDIFNNGSYVFKNRDTKDGYYSKPWGSEWDEDYDW